MSKAKIIVIAGHGGRDPGAIANGVREADLTHAQMVMLQQQLLARNYTVASPSSSLPLKDKIAFAEKNTDARLLVDLHFNAATPAAHGTETYVRVNAGEFENVLAENLSRGIADVLGTHNRGKKTENLSQHGRLGILHTGIPSVLIETCFITNSSDLDAYLAATGAVARRIADIIDTALSS